MYPTGSFPLTLLRLPHLGTQRQRRTVRALKPSGLCRGAQDTRRCQSPKDTAVPRTGHHLHQTSKYTGTPKQSLWHGLQERPQANLCRGPTGETSTPSPRPHVTLRGS